MSRESGPGPGRGPERVWRPGGLVVVSRVVGVLLLVAALGMWFLMPAEIRAAFNGLEIATLALVLVALLGGLYGLGRTRIAATDAGLTVVNAFVTHRLDWAQVLHVDFRQGAPWAVLDLDDGTTVSVMALQSADGVRARRAVAELRALVEAHTRTGRDD